MRLAIFVTLIAFSCSVSALSIQDWPRAKQSELFLVHINGVGQGLSWANAWLAVEGRPKIYCEPQKGLTAEHYLMILEREMNNKKYLEGLPPETPLEVIFAQGLINNFPCKK